MKIKLCFLLYIFITIFSCVQEVNEQGTEVEYEINKEYISGPIKVNFKVDRTEISLADNINLVLEVIVDKEYELGLPVFGEKLEQFGIVDYYNEKPQLIDEDHIKAGCSYVLEPFLSGEYKIPPMKIYFRTGGDLAEGVEEGSHEIETEEITITVTSLLQEDYENLSIKPIAGSIDPPPASLPWYLFLIAFIIIAGSVTGLFLYKKARDEERNRIITIPAHEHAYNELRKLVAKKYIEKQEYKLFYYKISNILRHYIENRYNLHAPEQTTEEFLDIIYKKEHGLFNSEQKELLKDFMVHCDMVKFTDIIPSTEEVQKTFNTCKDFIENTRDREVRIPAEGEVNV